MSLFLIWLIGLYPAYRMTRDLPPDSVLGSRGGALRISVWAAWPLTLFVASVTAISTWIVERVDESDY